MIIQHIIQIALSLVFLLSVSARADEYVLTLKDHQFSPANLQVPANRKFMLIVKNAETDKAEFESSDLDREQVVDVGSQITVFLGPLDPGSYGYFDDYHQRTVGNIVAK